MAKQQGSYYKDTHLKKDPQFTDTFMLRPTKNNNPRPTESCQGQKSQLVRREALRQHQLKARAPGLSLM